MNNNLLSWWWIADSVTEPQYDRSSFNEVSPAESPRIKSHYSKDLIVIYNRIPKTGSTSFINVAYDLCKINSFNVIHLNVTKNSHYLSLADQVWFSNNFICSILLLYSKFKDFYLEGQDRWKLDFKEYSRKKFQPSHLTHWPSIESSMYLISSTFVSLQFSNLKTGLMDC